MDHTKDAEILALRGQVARLRQELADAERRVWLEAAEIAEYYSLPKRALSDSAYKSGGMNTRAGIATALRARAGKGEP